MTTWYIARGAGLAALVLFSASTMIGALMAGGGRSSVRVVGNYLHRSTTALALATFAVHITAILADSYAHVGWVAALVPFTSEYRASWVGFGTLTIYTFAAVAVVGLARARFATSERATRVWRRLHGLAYAGWAMAMLHGFFSGTDSSVGWVRLLYVVCGAAVLGAAAARLVTVRSPQWRRTPAVAR